MGSFALDLAWRSENVAEGRSLRCTETTVADLTNRDFALQAVWVWGRAAGDGRGAWGRRARPAMLRISSLVTTRRAEAPVPRPPISSGAPRRITTSPPRAGNSDCATSFQDAGSVAQRGDEALAAAVDGIPQRKCLVIGGGFG